MLVLIFEKIPKTELISLLNFAYCELRKLNFSRIYNYYAVLIDFEFLFKQVLSHIFKMYYY